MKRTLFLISLMALVAMSCSKLAGGATPSPVPTQVAAKAATETPAPEQSGGGPVDEAESSDPAFEATLAAALTAVAQAPAEPTATMIPSGDDPNLALGVYPGLNGGISMPREFVDSLVRAGGYTGVWESSQQDPDPGRTTTAIEPLVFVLAFGGNGGGKQPVLTDVSVARAVCSQFPGSTVTVTWRSAPGQWKGMIVPSTGDFSVPEDVQFWTCHGPGNTLPPTWTADF